MPSTAKLHSLFCTKSVHVAGYFCNARRQGLASVTCRGSWLTACTGAVRLANRFLTPSFTKARYLGSTFPLQEVGALESDSAQKEQWSGLSLAYIHTERNGSSYPHPVVDSNPQSVLWALPLIRVKREINEKFLLLDERRVKAVQS